MCALTLGGLLFGTGSPASALRVIVANGHGRRSLRIDREDFVPVDLRHYHPAEKFGLGTNTQHYSTTRAILKLTTELAQVRKPGEKVGMVGLSLGGYAISLLSAAGHDTPEGQHVRDTLARQLRTAHGRKRQWLRRNLYGADELEQQIEKVITQVQEQGSAISKLMLVNSPTDFAHDIVPALERAYWGHGELALKGWKLLQGGPFWADGSIYAWVPYWLYEDAKAYGALPAAGVPTKIIVAKNDGMIDPAGARVWASNQDLVDLVELKTGGHGMKGQHRAVAIHMLKFFQEKTKRRKIDRSQGTKSIIAATQVLEIPGLEN